MIEYNTTSIMLSLTGTLTIRDNEIGNEEPNISSAKRRVSIWIHRAVQLNENVKVRLQFPKLHLVIMNFERLIRTLLIHLLNFFQQYIIVKRWHSRLKCQLCTVAIHHTYIQVDYCKYRKYLQFAGVFRIGQKKIL